jgi:hypothetical protein
VTENNAGTNLPDTPEMSSPAAVGPPVLIAQATSDIKAGTPIAFVTSPGVIAPDAPKAGSNFTKIMVAVLTVIVTVPTTYFINEYLSRDHISIETIEIKPIMRGFSLSDDLMYQTSADYGNVRSEFHIWLDQQPQKVQDIFRERQTYFDDDDFENFSAAVTRFLTWLDKRIGDTVEFQSRWERRPKRPLDTSERSTSRRSSTQPSAEEMYFDFMRKDFPRLLKVAKALRIIVDDDIINDETLSESAADRLKRLQESKTIFSELKSNANSFKKERTGDVNIHVTFVNLGNTDGIITSHGWLLLDSGERLPMKEWDGNDLKVEKRSALAASWTLDNDKASRKEEDYFFQLMKHYADKTATLELIDFRGRVIRSAATKLPIGD